MHSVTLSGLDGSNPLGFLAAIGVLRVLSERTWAETPRMSWQQAGYWVPHLHFVVERDGLLDVLEQDLHWDWATDPALGLKYAKGGDGKTAWDLKPPPAVFRKFLKRLLDDDSPAGRRALRYAAAYAAEGPIDNNGLTKPFALHFTAGQQEFLDMVCGLSQGTTRQDLSEALFGPWTYSRPLPVLAWDSSTTRDYALRASDPSKDKKLGVPGADWLAFRGVAVLRSVAIGDRIATTGCYGGWKSGGFRWPLWTRATTYRTVEALVNSVGLSELGVRERKLRGVACVWQSRIRRSDQGGYGSFAPSELV